jgi:hypothetical protein
VFLKINIVVKVVPEENIICNVSNKINVDMRYFSKTISIYDI